MKKIMILLFAIAGLATAATVPDFTAEDLEGISWSLDSLMGERLTIISFWSTSCAPCKEELKLLDSLYEIYADSGLAIIAVNTDTKRGLPKVEPMVTAHEWDFPVLVDPDGDLMRIFKVGPIPHSFYIKPDKVILKAMIGYTKKDKITILETVQKAMAGNYTRGSTNND